MPAIAATAPPARREPRQSRARVTHDAILEATTRLLERSDPKEPPSTNRIARLAGVSVGTLYQYFDSREDIVRALARRHGDEMRALMVMHTAPYLSVGPREAVPAFIDAMAAAHAHSPRLHLALLRELLANDSELLAELQAPALALVRAWLEQHRAAVRPKDLDAAAHLLTHAVEAAVHGQLLETPHRLGDAAWRAELVDLLQRYLFE